MSNLPTNNDGYILIDFYGFTNTRHYQLAISYLNNYFYFRNNKNGVWDDWKKIMDEEHIKNIINTTCFKQSNSSITNLNDATTGFAYYANGGIDNLPNGVSRCVLNSIVGSQNNIFQYIYNGRKTYSRAKLNGVWEDWRTYVTEDSIAPAQTLPADLDIDDIDNGIKYYFVPSTNYNMNKLPSINGGLLFSCIDKSYTTRGYQMFFAYFNNKIYIRNKVNGTYTNWKELLTELPPSVTGKNKIVKNSDTQFTIYFGDYNIKLLKIENDTINSHAWNILDIRDFNNNILVPSGTDIIGPIKEYGEIDFMGGVHGDETVTLFEIYCDGNTYDRESTVEFNSLDIIMQSDLHRVSTKETIANRKIHVSITDNEIHVYSQITALTNFTVEKCTNGGLIAARNNIITGLFINNYLLNEASDTSISGIKSKFNTSATIFTSIGKITVENIVGHELDTYRGYITVFTNENPIRTKIYLDTISSPTAISTNDTITGEFKYTFNK